MPTFQRDGIELYYEVHGEGFPVLTFAPGGMRSAVELWSKAPWNPIDALADRFQVIAMDQRNAGRSTAPITATDGWDDYATDHLALLDHLGIERCHALGMCIGGAFCLKLIDTAPERVAAAVLMQPIGADDNAEAFAGVYEGWAGPLRAARPEVDAAAWSALQRNMFGGDFVFSVSRDAVSRCQTPLLVLLGDDVYHPAAISREIVALAPNADLIERWKQPDATPDAKAEVRSFLERHQGPGR